MRIVFDADGTTAPRPGSRRRLAVIVGLALVAMPALVLAGHQFSDVPDSHKFHAHITAIADAGVTAGCGGGKYCPDGAVTRGEMAVFLNRLGALGPGMTPVVNADRLDGLDSDAFMPATAEFMPAATYVTFDEGVILAGEFSVVAGTCDDGDQLLSGGYFDVGFNTRLFDNFPHPVGQWEIFGLNQGLADDTISVYVMCADYPPLHEEPPDLTAPQRDPTD